jgi:ribosomal protein S13
LSTVITQKAGLNVNSRAGDLTDENLEKIIDIVSKPLGIKKRNKNSDEI